MVRQRERGKKQELNRTRCLTSFNPPRKINYFPLEYVIVKSFSFLNEKTFSRSIVRTRGWFCFFLLDNTLAAEVFRSRLFEWQQRKQHVNYLSGSDGETNNSLHQQDNGLMIPRRDFLILGKIKFKFFLTENL